MIERKEGAAGASAREGGRGARGEGEADLDQGQREGGGGRKEGTRGEREVGSGAVGFFPFLCMDGWMDVGLIATDGRMLAISSICATNGSTNHNVVRTLMIL